jgi:aspartate aminotransferase-like enzyme
MMSKRALERLETTTSNSFTVDLKKWRQIMEAYLKGGHAYHATMPTDALRDFRDTMVESAAFGFDALRDAQWYLGDGVRKYFASKGLKSVAADGFAAPGVVVCYTDDPDIQNGSKFVGAGMQIAAGVPLAVDEPEDFRTFRVGLFGIDKLRAPDVTLKAFTDVADKVL